MTATLYWRAGLLVEDRRIVGLTPKEKLLLVALCRGHPQDHSNERLIQVLWPDPDAEPSDARNTLHVHSLALKRKIAPFGLQLIARWRRRDVVGDLHVNWSGAAPRAHRAPLPSRPYELELRA